MKRVTKCCLVLVALIVCLFAGTARAQDTSPYLAGFWAEDYHWFKIVNPTTKPLVVYAIFYNSYHGPFNGLECYKSGVQPNGVFGMEFMSETKGKFGTVKFFAFPAGTRKFDPNAIIGGFQRKFYEDTFNPRGYSLESNLKAVTINSFTLQEFSTIPPDNDGCFAYSD